MHWRISFQEIEWNLAISIRINWAGFSPFPCTSYHPICFSCFPFLSVFLLVVVVVFCLFVCFFVFNFISSVSSLSLYLPLFHDFGISVGIILGRFGPFHCTSFCLSTFGCSHRISNFLGFFNCIFHLSYLLSRVFFPFDSLISRFHFLKGMILFYHVTYFQRYFRHIRELLTR